VYWVTTKNRNTNSSLNLVTDSIWEQLVYCCLFLLIISEPNPNPNLTTPPKTQYSPRHRWRKKKKKKKKKYGFIIYIHSFSDVSLLKPKHRHATELQQWRQGGARRKWRRLLPKKQIGKRTLSDLGQINQFKNIEISELPKFFVPPESQQATGNPTKSTFKKKKKNDVFWQNGSFTISFLSFSEIGTTKKKHACKSFAYSEQNAQRRFLINYQKKKKNHFF